VILLAGDPHQGSADWHHTMARRDEPVHVWIPGKRWPNDVQFDGKLDGHNQRGNGAERGECPVCKKDTELCYEVNNASNEFSTEWELRCRTCWWESQERCARESMYQHNFVKRSCDRQDGGKFQCTGGRGPEAGLHCPAHRYDFALYSAVVKVATGRGVPVPHLPDRKKCFIGSNAAIKNVMQADDELMTEVYLKCMVATVPAQNQGKKRKAAAPAAAQHKPKRPASSGASSSGASSSTGVRLCLDSHGQPCATNLAGLEPWKKRCLSCYRAGNKVQRPTSTTWS
jgi:hypothetical protein